jgi:hypothetical protein
MGCWMMNDGPAAKPQAKEKRLVQRVFFVEMSRSPFVIPSGRGICSSADHSWKCFQWVQNRELAVNASII